MSPADYRQLDGFLTDALVWRMEQALKADG
jgi:hypothetical protein